MGRRVFIAVSGTLAMVMGGLTLSQTMSAQKAVAETARKGGQPPIYNPYPPGLLPSDLQSELDRVAREVDLVFQ
jgi:hypothetical protein